VCKSPITLSLAYVKNQPVNGIHVQVNIEFQCA